MSSGAPSPRTNERSDGNDVGFSGFEITDQSAPDPNHPKKVAQIRYQCGYQGPPVNGTLPIYYAPSPMLTWSDSQPANASSPSTFVTVTVSPNQGTPIQDVLYLWVQVTCADSTTSNWIWTYGGGSNSGASDTVLEGVVALTIVGAPLPTSGGRQALMSVALTWDGTTLKPATPDYLSTARWDQS